MQKNNIYCPTPNIFSNEIFDLIKKNKYLNLVNKSDPNIHSLLIRFNTKANSKYLSSFKKLKFLISPTTGVNHIDIDYLKEKKIKLICLKNKQVFLKKINASAEHTISLILSILKKIPMAVEDVKKNNWSSEKFVGEELNNKTVGIIGYGRIGKKLASLCFAFNAKVIIYDPFKEKIDKKIKKYNDINLLIKHADIISINIPLNNKTENFFDKDKFKLMKKNSYLINTSRGEIIDQEILFEYLKTNKIKGAAIDVLQNEHSKTKIKYLLKATNKLSNLIVTPHIAGLTKESIQLTDMFVINKFIRELKK